MKYSKFDDSYALCWAKRIKAILFKGGKCELCGKDDIFILEFHHNKKDKEYEIGDGINKNIQWCKIEKEIQKCRLLCSNCHSEMHYTKSRGSIYKEKVLNCLKINKCSICGYRGKNFRSLCFHHRNPENKRFWLSNVFSRKDNVPVDEVFEEISECDIMCKNCHRSKHAGREKFDKLKNLIYKKVKFHRQIKRMDKGLVKELKDQGKGVCEIAKIMGRNKSSINYVYHRV